MQQAVKPKAPHQRTGRKYDADFKTEVLKMLASGQSAPYVAKALGISENLIYAWKSKNQKKRRFNSLNWWLKINNSRSGFGNWRLNATS